MDLSPSARRIRFLRRFRYRWRVVGLRSLATRSSHCALSCQNVAVFRPLAISSLGENPIQDMLRVTFRSVDGSAQVPAATRNGVTTGLKASLLVAGGSPTSLL